MGLLHEIQASLMDGGDLAPILLKLKFLGARLGSAPLEEWVHYESNGYPKDVEVPPYRIVHPSYQGTFSGPAGMMIKHAPIPRALIAQFASERWVNYTIRESVSAIEELIRNGGGQNGQYSIQASDLIIVLQGNIYEDMACNSIVGSIGRSALVAIQNSVREKILGFTIDLEKAVPIASEIDIGSKSSNISPESEKVTKIVNHIVHGNYTTISNSGSNSTFTFNLTQGDQAAFAANLIEAGISKADANELAEIVASEQPDGSGQFFGAKAKEWIGKNIGKALDGTWKVGLDAAGKVLAAAAIAYYGIGPT